MCIKKFAKILKCPWVIFFMLVSEFVSENSRQCILSLNVKSTTFSWKILLNFIKIGEIY